MELTKEGFGGLDDHFGHFDVGPINHGGRAVSDQAAELVQLQLALAKQSFEHCHDVNDQRRFLFAQHDDTFVGRHDVRALMEAGVPLAESSSAGVRIGGEKRTATRDDALVIGHRDRGQSAGRS